MREAELSATWPSQPPLLQALFSQPSAKARNEPHWDKIACSDRREEMGVVSLPHLCFWYKNENPSPCFIKERKRQVDKQTLVLSESRCLLRTWQRIVFWERRGKKQEWSNLKSPFKCVCALCVVWQEIDDCLIQAKDRSYDALVHFGKRGLNVAATAAVMAASKVTMQTMAVALV